MQFIITIFTCCFIGFMLFIPLFFYRSVYFKPVAALFVDDGKCTVCSIKPNRRYFKSFGSDRGLVHLGSGYYAFYVPAPISNVSFNNFNISSDFYIFRRTRLGRFTNVDLSDRSINDIIKKINYEVKK